MIFLGIGSNLSSKFGDRQKNIELAISFLKKYKINVFKKSSYYETFSYPNKKDPKFLNVVVSVNTNLKPENLITVLINIEKKLERKREKKNEPRTCDIDIIDYNQQIIEVKNNALDLTIPHKNMSNRNFVLYPLKEICPNWKHPITKTEINDLIDNLKIENNEITKLSLNGINKHVEK